MLNFNSILLYSENPDALGEFYKKVFDKEPDMNENGYVGFIVGATFLNIGPHDKVKGTNSNPERIMFNFETPQVKEEFERVKALGATVIAEPQGMGDDTWIATFADPDGNFFQLITPWEDMVKK